MDDTQTEHGHGHSGPAKAVSQLSESMAHTAESQRALFQEMSLFAKDEGLRFVNLRLERNGQALDRMQNCHGIPGLISVQQEWLRDFVQDYIGEWESYYQNMSMPKSLPGIIYALIFMALELRFFRSSCPIETRRTRSRNYSTQRAGKWFPEPSATTRPGIAFTS